MSSGGNSVMITYLEEPGHYSGNPGILGQGYGCVPAYSIPSRDVPGMVWCN